MEIYKELSSPASQKFEKLLNSQLSKNKIEEGKIIDGKITKITDKYIFLFIPGLKSEPVIDINEMKMIGMEDKVEEGTTISVLLEKIEDKNGDVIVSAQKAQKIKGWYNLEKSYEENKSINGKIVSKCKGGVIVEHVDTGSLMFCPGSQISDKPLKSIDHLIGVEQKFAIIKLDKVRGNACVSRRQIVSSNKKEDKVKDPATELDSKKPSYMALKQDECNATVKVTEKTGLEIVGTESFDVNVCKREVNKVIN